MDGLQIDMVAAGLEKDKLDEKISLLNTRSVRHCDCDCDRL